MFETFYQPSSLRVLAVRSFVRINRNDRVLEKTLSKIMSPPEDLRNHGSWCNKRNTNGTYDVLCMIRNEDVLCLDDLYLTGQLRFWPPLSMVMAIMTDSVHMLKFLRFRGCPWENKNIKDIVWYAVSGGKFNCLSFIIGNNFSFNYNEILTFAVQNLALDEHEHKKGVRLKCFLYVWLLEFTACADCRKFLHMAYFMCKSAKSLTNVLYNVGYRRVCCSDGLLKFVLYNIG